MSFLKILELRPARPEDLKVDNKTLKIGQPYCIGEKESDNIKGIYVLTGAEDPLVLSMYFKAGLIFIPLNDFKLTEFLKNEHE